VASNTTDAFTQKTNLMVLEVLISKKGTKVVTASALYMALRLPSHHYGTTVRKWMKDVYEMSHGFRKPEIMRDYAKRPRPEEPVEDYYLTLELARLITLRSTSKEKVKIAKYLAIREKAGQMELFQTAA
jgi:hypothetical protein